VLTDRTLHGLLNGTHSFSTVCGFFRQEPVEPVEGEDKRVDPADLWVPIHFFTGITQDNIEAITAGLNTNFQVDDMSIMNNAGGFDVLKAVLGDPLNGAANKPSKKAGKYSGLVAYHQNDSGYYKASDIVIRLLSLHSKSAVSDMYRSSGKAMKRYGALISQDDSIIKALSGDTPRLIRLYERVADLSLSYGKRWLKRKFKFPHLRTIARHKGTSKEVIKVRNSCQKLPFTTAYSGSDHVLAYTVLPAWSVSFMEALRPNIRSVSKSGKVNLYVSWDDLLPEVTEKIMERLYQRVVKDGADIGTIVRTSSDVEALTDGVTVVMTRRLGVKFDD